jgi:hypothetical protein
MGVEMGRCSPVMPRSPRPAPRHSAVTTLPPFPLPPFFPSQAQTLSLVKKGAHFSGGEGFVSRLTTTISVIEVSTPGMTMYS